MTFTVHAAVGAAAGAAAGSLWGTAPGAGAVGTGQAAAGVVVGFLLGFASHAVLDAVPHWDYQRTQDGVVDVLLGALLVVLLAAWIPPAQSLWAEPWFWGAVGGVLPDVEVFISHFRRQAGRTSRLLYPSHTGRTPHRQVPPWPLGIPSQLIFLAAALSVFAVYA